MSHSWIRIIFISTVALFAAVLGDFVSEGISNAQILWHGHYTDQSSLNVVPVFALAVLAAAVTLGLLVRQRLTGKARLSMRTLLLSTSRSLLSREIARFLPVAFVMQMLVLFCMETLEQYVVYGHCLGGTLWLGAPVVASLLIHAAFTLTCAFAISRALRALTATVAQIVKCIVTLRTALSLPRPACTLRPERSVCALSLLLADSTGERGPPLRTIFE